MPSHVNNNTGQVEWHTPKEIVELSRFVMQGIDLDPASSEYGNSRVRAKRFYTKETNGLIHEWHGNVFLNPPYSRGQMILFIEKLIIEIESGRCKQCVLVSNNASETQWGQIVIDHADLICVPAGRIHFIDRFDVKQKNTLQGQFISYFGPHHKAFYQAFSKMGHILRKYHGK